MLGGKTGELCRVACQLGVRASGGNDEVVEALGMYGNAVGIAFQIADDFLDLWGKDDTVGKTLGTDIGQGKMTLPLIRLLQSSSPRVRREAIGILEGPVEERLRRIRPLLNNSDAKTYTLDVAQSFQRQAFAALDVLVPSEARDSLTAIGHFAIDRRF
jgi:octaprenyl-diphosphate synthase